MAGRGSRTMRCSPLAERDGYIERLYCRSLMFPLRIGTRGSPLALWQAHDVADRLRGVAPDRSIELFEIETEGDRIRDVPLVALGGQGAFTKAIQQALLDHRA